MPIFPFYDLITDYKNHIDMTKYVIEWKDLINKFGLIVYCLEEKIDLGKEKEHLNKLFIKHRLLWGKNKFFSATKNLSY